MRIANCWGARSGGVPVPQLLFYTSGVLGIPPGLDLVGPCGGKGDRNAVCRVRQIRKTC
ncbi:MAG: hypothetical protein WCD53_12565 [Microcoleus sp.]